MEIVRSQRKYYKFCPEKSILATCVYEYITNNKIYLFIEPTEITLKYVNTNIGNIQLENILVIPKNQNFNTAYSIESNIQSRIGNKFDNTLFDDVLTHFIEDLFIYDNFKETGDNILLMQSVEQIPLLQGIAFQTTHDFYFNKVGVNKSYDLAKNVFAKFTLKILNTLVLIIKILSGKSFNKFAVLINKLNERLSPLDFSLVQSFWYNKYKFAYENWSRFLQNSNNEMYFREGGWFNSKNTSIELPYKGLDYYLTIVESNKIHLVSALQNNKFVQVSSSSEKPNLSNIKTILKRYGIYKSLEITLGKWVANVFIFLTSSLFFFIILDLCLYLWGANAENPNLWGVNVENPNQNFSFSTFQHCYNAILYSFIFYTVFIFYILSKRYGLQLVPAIFLPRLIIAILSGWIFFIGAEELLKIDINIDGIHLLIVSIVVLAVTMMFMVFEINNNARTMDLFQNIKRSLVVLTIGFLISYSFGFVVMTWVNARFFSIDSFIVNESQVNKKILEDKAKIEKFRLFILNASFVIDNIESTSDTYLDFINLKKELTDKKNQYDSISTKAIRPRLIKNNLVLKKEINNLEKEVLRLDSKLFNEKIATINNSTVPYSLYFEVTNEIKNIDKTDTLNSLKIKYIDSLQLSLTNLILKSNTLKKLSETNVKFKSDTLTLILNKKTKAAKSFIEGFNKDQYVMSIENTNINDLFTNNLKINSKMRVNGKNIFARNYKFWLFKEVIPTFPKMIFLRALIAMFIGIFLQLIIQDKTVTEPI